MIIPDPPPIPDLNRRTLLRWITAAAILPAVLPASHAHAELVAGFEAVPASPAIDALHYPEPPLAPPAGSSATVFDIFGNHWTLAPASADGHTRLLVLPAQSPHQWIADDLSALPADTWCHLAADEFGYVWIASATRILRLDPHTPQAGWTDFTTDLHATTHASAPSATISALGIAASGAVALAMHAGPSTNPASLIAELDRDKTTTVAVTAAPPDVDRILCDDRGDLWLGCGHKTFRKPAAPDAWQRRWELVDRLPAGDHDLSGDVLHGLFYMAGGQNAGWGYPAVPHVFRELFAFDPAARRWRVAARLTQPRYYNGTSFLDDSVWVIGGYTRDEHWNPIQLTSVEVWDPATGNLSPGPPLPLALDNPVAMHLDGRIYVAGCQLAPNAGLTGPHRPCILLSIGTGEPTWRREPDGPAFLLALAATTHHTSLYLALAGKGLGRFDTRTRTWQLIPITHAARSPQMATYGDEIWIMGGRDIDHQDAVTIYNPVAGTFRSGPNLPRPLAWGAAVEIAGSLMVVGGAAGRGYNNRTFFLRDHTV